MTDGQQWVFPVVQRGRPPTPIGGDGIDPWMRVEHWQTRSIGEMLRGRRIDHRVSAFGRINEDEHDIHIRFDRISFPGGDYRKLRDLFDGWRPERDSDLKASSRERAKAALRQVRGSRGAAEST